MNENPLQELLDNNAKWAAELTAENPGLFAELSKGQSPRFLWIGCADSRMPSTTQLGTGLGDIFIHRNIANLVSDDDNSAQAIIEFAVSHLNVQHIVICGHYSCGGVKAAAALDSAPNNVIEQWVMPIKRLYDEHIDELQQLDEESRHKKLCEINVAQQVENVCRHPAVINAWQQQRTLDVNGMIYDIGSGLLRDLQLSRSG